MRKYAKWIEVDPNAAVAEVAVLALRSRLEPVQDYVVLAAKKPDEDVEYVHQMRVWSRRGMAALRAFRPCLPKRRRRWLRDQLQWIRRASNDARDHDVFALRLARDQDDPGAAKLLERVRTLRQQAQGPIVEVYAALVESGKLKRRAAKLLERVQARGADADPLPFGKWAAKRIGRLCEKFFSAADADLGDVEALHRLRIRGKKLRYAMELLASAFPDPFRTRLYPMVRDVQDRLGEINDHATAIARLGRWIEQSDDAEEAAYLRHRLCAERADLDTKRDQFLQWWNAEQEKKLRKGFAKLLD